MKLIDYTLNEYIEKAKDNTSIPGGGSIAALCGSLSSSLIIMVNNLSKNKENYLELEDSAKKSIEDIVNKAETIQTEMKDIIDEDSRAFDDVLRAYKLPKSTKEEIEIRKLSIEKGYLKAIEVPLKTIKLSIRILRLCNEILPYSNINAISDLAIATILAHSATEASTFNIIINIKGIKDPQLKEEILDKKDQLVTASELMKKDILRDIHGRL